MLVLEKASPCSELDRFFRKVVSRDVVDNIYEPDTAFCNCRVAVRMFEVSGNFTIHVGEVPPEEFLDDANTPSLGWRAFAARGSELTWTAIQMVANRGLFFAGFYCQQTHTLVATNWVYSPDASPLIRLIAEAMGWPSHYNIPNDSPPPAMLGGDPEFECWLPGTGIVRPDGGDIYRDAHLGEVGIDGSGAVCEARPLPTPDPAELYWRIRSLVQQWESLTGYRACLSGHQFPIGCHIHLGGPLGWRLVGNYSRFVQEVDDRVGHVLLLSGRARGNYYVRAAWRNQPHGVEYRTPPGSVLAFPETFIWIASVMKAIAAGDPPPPPQGQVTDQLEAIREAINRGIPFTFELESLQDLPPAHRIVLSGDRFGRAFADWVQALNLSGRVLRDARIFGYARHRGHVTNVPAIAEAMGWELIRTRPRTEPSIGLPYDFRVAGDHAGLRALETVLVQMGILSP